MPILFYKNGPNLRLRKLPEFKPMTENFQDKLHQEECNNQKVPKFVLVLEENLSVKNTPKLSAKYLQDKLCKTKQMQNITLTLEDIFKSTKSTKEDSSNTITS